VNIIGRSTMAVDEQRVGLGIDVGYAAVVALEVQVRGRDRAVEILVRVWPDEGRAARLAQRLFGWAARCPSARLGLPRTLPGSARRLQAPRIVTVLAERDDAGGAGGAGRGDRVEILSWSPR